MNQVSKRKIRRSFNMFEEDKAGGMQGMDRDDFAMPSYVC